MPKVPADNADWERQREEIYRLYFTENKNLKTVITAMTERHGFTRTKAQYERVFKKWNWRKNLTAKEWKIVAQRIQKRKAERPEIEPEVRVQGILIPSKKLKKEIWRYNYPSTSQLFQIPSNGLDTTKIPSDITIVSPKLTPTTAALAEIQCLPWQQFLDFVETIRQPASRSLIHLPRESNLPTAQALPHPGTNHNELEETLFQKPETIFQRFVNDLTEALYFDLGDGAVALSSMYTTTHSFIPPSSRCISNIDVTAILDLSTRTSQLELLKLAVSLISNGPETYRIASVLVELFQDPRNLALFQELLKQRFPSIDAVAEKLLAPAAYTGNMELVTILIENGVHADSKGPADVLGRDRSALEAAIEASSEGSRKAIVRYLLDHGADPHLPCISKGGILLDYAVKTADINVIEEFLNPRHKSVISRKTLCHGARTGKPYIMDLLLHHIGPSYADRETQCLIMEAATFYGNTEVADLLLRRGFDIKSTDRAGYGSALAAASYNGQTDLVLYLIDRGADLNGIGVGMEGTSWDGIPLLASWRTKNTNITYRNETALQASLHQNHTEIARLLVLSGADPNYLSRTSGKDNTVAPIKLASQFCDIATVQVLLRGGADPNAPVIRLLGLRFRPTRGEYFRKASNEQLNARTAVQIAFERGSFPIVQALLKSGAKIPSSDFSASWDPFESALIGGERQIVDLILRQMTSISNAQHYLQACIESGRLSLARNLIDEKIFCMGRDTCSPGIIYAAIIRGFEQKDTSFADYLLSGTIEVLGHLPTDLGTVALATAASENSVDLIRKLLDAGARPCVPCPGVHSVFANENELLQMKEKTAFDMVFTPWETRDTRYFQELITRPVLKLFTDVCSSSSHRTSGEHYCQRTLESAFLQTCKHFSGLPIAKSLMQSLLNSGVDVNCKPNNFKLGTALQLVMRYGRGYDSEIVVYLLEAGANANCKATRYLGTPLQFAVQANDVRIVKLLIQHGAEVNAKPASTWGSTAVQYAASNGNFEILNILLELGADKNAPRSSYDGRTAIEGAAEWGRLDMVCYLLEAGADVKGKENGQYRRSVYRACKEGHRTVARMIQEYKERTYGSGDVCSVEEIISSMSEIELDGSWHTEMTNLTLPHM